MPKIVGILLVGSLALPLGARAAIYHVDPAGSATPPYDTPQKAAHTIQAVLDEYDLTGGDVVRVSGTISGQTTRIASGDRGLLRHALEPVSVSGSTVTFSSAPAGVSTGGDYVYLYNSFAGNSGCFKVTAVSGNDVSVDTSDLPTGGFVAESASPWTLQAAIVAPLVIAGSDPDDPPVLEGGNDAFRIGPSAGYILIKDVVCTDQTRAAFLITTGSEYIAISHLQSRRPGHFGSLICSCEDAQGGTNGIDVQRIIVQHCDFSGAGHIPDSTGELMYLGKDYMYQTGAGGYTHVLYTQIMYNAWHDNVDYGDDRSNPDPLDGKENDRYTIIWGNRFHDCDAGSVYGILKIPGGESVIANNLFEGNDSTGDGLTGVITGFSYTGMTGYDQYIFNNVFDRNTANYGNIVLDGLNLPNLHIYNNTFYGVKGSDTGIRLAFWSSDTTVGHIHNNIFENLGTAVNMPAGSAIADDDNNFFYENNTDFAGWTPQGTVYTEDPGLADPSVGDFNLHGSSAARDRGTSFANIFKVDFRHFMRDSSFDVGAYEYQAVDDTPPAAPTNLEVSAPP